MLFYVKMSRGGEAVKNKDTRFSYVYNDLKGRIKNGQLQQGKYLPSSRQLCKRLPGQHPHNLTGVKHSEAGGVYQDRAPHRAIGVL